jgi:autotransporter-associated beta strand protein
MITKIKKLSAAFAGLLLASGAFGQTTYIFTNQTPSHPAVGDMGISTNWDPNGLPNPGSTDVAEFNGVTTGPLAVTLNGNLGGNSGNPGIQFYMAAGQTSSLQIGPPAGVNAGTPRANGLQIDSGAGQFTFGDDTVNSLEIVWGSAFTHLMENDSSYPAIIKPNLKWRNGGGGTHIWNYAGAGDWYVYNYMHCDNSGNGSGVDKSGTGTMYWFGTNVPNAQVAVTVGAGLNLMGGTLVLESPDLLVGCPLQLDTAGAGGTLLIYNATNGSGAFSGTISGTGPLEVSTGNLTVSGFNTYTGSNYLKGGELVLSRAENPGVNGPLGVGGIISFAGGILGYSSANTYDYSSRFDATPGQKYQIDVPSGLSVSLANGLTSSGGTLAKLGGGTLVLGGVNTYSGATTVTAGTLLIQGPVGNGSISVADGQTLAVTETGTAIAPTALSLGTTGGANLEFFNVTNGVAAPIAVSGAVTTAGPITVTIGSGVFGTIGATYPLLSWGSGAPPAFNNPPSVSGAAGTLSVVGNTLVLTITATPYVWSGGTSGSWDSTTSGNWKQSGSPVVWHNGVLTLFDDTAVGNTNVTVSGDLSPLSVTFDADATPYTVTSSPGNLIDGVGSLTMSGNSTLTLAGGVNAYSGPTTVSGGTLIVSTLANGGTPSDIGASSSAATNLVLNGGTLQYIGGGATVDRQVTVGTAGGTLDASGSGTLTFSANKSLNLVGNGVHAVNLIGTSAGVLTANITDTSSGSTLLTKNGAGTWTLLGTNTYTGSTTLHNGGTLQIGNGGGSGTIGSGPVNLLNNSQLRFDSAGTVLVSGPISGNGSITNDGTGTTILAANNTYTGDTVINSGTLQIGNGGATGSFGGNGSITNNGKLVFNSTGNLQYTGNGIHGTGNVEIKAGVVKPLGINDYTGWTLIDSGAIFTPTDNNQGNPGILSTSVVTNNGTLRLEGYTTRTPMYANIVGTGKLQIGTTGGAFDNGDQVLGGTNTYTGGTFIGGAHLILGDGATPGAGSIVGNVTFVNNFEDANDGLKRLIFDRPDDFTFAGNIITNFTSPQNYKGTVTQNGSGRVTLTGTNTYADGTIINSGTVEVGNGGLSGSIGSGPVTDNSALIWNQSSTTTFPGSITGTGTFVKTGAGSLTLANTNLSFGGQTTISNGTLIVTGQVVPGQVQLGTYDLYLEGGTYIAGGIGTLVTNVLASNLYIDAGTLVATVNKSLPGTNTLFLITNVVNQSAGVAAATGGTMKVINSGPALQPGDKFYLFSQPVSGGATMNLQTPGFTAANNLAVDGSIAVTSVLPNPTLSVTISQGTNLTLQWPSGWTGGVHLQVQTNTLATGLSTNWYTIPGTDAGNSYLATVVRTNPTVYYRLITP